MSEGKFQLRATLFGPTASTSKFSAGDEGVVVVGLNIRIPENSVDCSENKKETDVRKAKLADIQDNKPGFQMNLLSKNFGRLRMSDATKQGITYLKIQLK